MTEKHYEIYVDSVYGSDVVVKYDVNEAIAEAIKWSETTDKDVVVELVESKVQFMFNKGKVTYDCHKENGII